MKFIIILITISISIFAKSVVIEASGTYTQLKFAKSSPVPDETSYARQQALMFAKQSAVEEAETTLYVSFTSITKSNGHKKSKYEIKAIASAMIKTKILSEGWSGNKYTVNIRATVDSKDAEDVFKKADKRLRDITKLQETNEQLLANIKKISNKIFSIGKNSNTTTNTLAIHKMNSKQKIEYFNQVKLIDQYEENILLMKINFKKGTLLDLADKEEKRINVNLKKAKEAFDKTFTNGYRKNFVARIINIKVTKHGDTGDVSFLLFYGLKDNSRKKFVNYMSGLHEWFDRQTRQWHKAGYYGQDDGYLILKENPDANRLREWLKKNRNFAIKVSLGGRSYYTEPMASYHEHISEYSNGIKSYRNVYVFFKNSNGMMTERVMKNIPLSELGDIESLSAELAYSHEDPRKPSLPMVREAKEYYNGYREIKNK